MSKSIFAFRHAHCSCVLSKALDILQYEGNDMEAKARRQILALLLTAAHYGGPLDMIFINWYEGVKPKPCGLDNNNT